MKITGLKISNFLIIKDVELKDINSKLNAFVGKNRHGKTSFIKAITTGLRGTTDPTVIREGADKSEIMLDLEGLKVQRTIKRKGNNTLKVTTSQGDIKASPQSYLDGLLSDFSFDPIRFVLLEGKERVKYLRELFKTKLEAKTLRGVISDEVIERLDFEKDGFEVLKDAENVIYPVRTEKNKQVAQKKALYEEKRSKLDGFNPETFKDLGEEIEDAIHKDEKLLAEAQAAKKQIESTETLVKNLTQKVENAETEITVIIENKVIAHIPSYEAQITVYDRQIQELEEKRDATRDNLERAKEAQERTVVLEKEIEEHSSTIAALPSSKDIPDIQAIEERLAERKTDYEKNKQNKDLYEKHQQAEAIKVEYDVLKTETDSLTGDISWLRKEMPELLTKEANIPIPNLRFEGDKVFVGDKSLDNMSTSEQVEIALSIVRVMNKNAPLKILCLDKAESLDDETLEAFEKQIQDDEFQYFLTIVSHKGREMPEGAYHVEDGEVRKEKEITNA